MHPPAAPPPPHPARQLTRFFAGFCLLANGAYLALGWPSATGDTATLLRHGTPPWLLTLVGLTAIAAALTLWHHLGPHLGLTPRPANLPKDPE